MNTLVFDDVLDVNKYDCSTYFFSEIKRKEQENVHYNVLNDFILPLSTNDFDKPFFKINTIMHLSSMDVPTNLTRIDENISIIENSYGTRMQTNPSIKQMMTDIQNDMISNPNRKIPFYLVTKKIILYTDFAVLLGDTFQNYDILRIEQMNAVHLEFMCSIIGYG